MQVNIRAATVHDLKAVKAIDETLFGAETYPLFALRQLLDITNGLLLIAEESDKIAGYAIGHYNAVQEEAWFLSLGVLPEVRGLGIGESLTKGLINAVEQLGAKCIYLTVHPSNMGGIRIYEKLGFVKDSAENDYYGDGSPRLIMVKTSAI
ncbi:GNAT family N-acetyltransferase [Pontibacter cellulosilyticus]|uniref:GNAT family N-acetyltransferase n=1 Tax=Pontibacter cellulosilyticus TaxID=1720253 RepID=A0A923N3J4_9BACT|nr:GNAT family N-acetyltransferase [Pontibacter cellulosilyticus]MBC5991828.1 GNAT family N-acetyltransferase [Pontibacter cellulosilyticus]